MLSDWSTYKTERSDTVPIQNPNVNPLELRDAAKSQTRKPKVIKHPTFDLVRLYHEAVNRPEDYRFNYLDQKRGLQMFIDGYIRSRLHEIVIKTVEFDRTLPLPTTDNLRFVEVLTRKFPTLASSSVIAGLNTALRSMRPDAYYSDQEIAKYICSEFNKGRRLYGVYVALDEYGDVVFRLEAKLSQEEVRELVNSIDT